MSPLRIPGVLALCVAALAACDDGTSVTWYSAPDTVVLYSIESPVPNSPNAFDFIYRTRWLIESPEASGNWDVAIGSGADGFTIQAPASLGISSYAGIWTMEGTAWTDLTTAPADSAVYVQGEPVPLLAGNAYVIRTRKVTDVYGYTCAYYAKAQVVSEEPDDYKVSLVFDSNPNCYDLGLVPDSG